MHTFTVPFPLHKRDRALKALESAPDLSHVSRLPTGGVKIDSPRGDAVQIVLYPIGDTDEVLAVVIANPEAVTKHDIERDFRADIAKYLEKV